MAQWNPQDYKNNSSAQFKWANELLGKLQLKGTEKILDVGCGDGKITAKIAQSVPKGNVLGIDISPEMIQYAQKEFSPENWRNLRFDIKDLQKIEYQNQFDVIFSNAVLHWVKDHQSVLFRMYHALKSNGKLILSMGGKGNAAEILKSIEQLNHDSQWEPYFRNFSIPYGFYGIEEYRQWLTNAGFQIQRLELVPKDMQQMGEEGLRGWIRTTWMPYLEKVPEIKRETFLTQLISGYVHRFPPDLNGMVHVAMVRLEVEAIKPPRT